MEERYDDNFDGIDPTKMNEQELYQNIIDWVDFPVITGCYRYLSNTNPILAVKGALVVLNYPKENFRYGDDYLQATLLGFISIDDFDASIEYIKNNYGRVEPIVFEKMLLCITDCEEPNAKEAQQLLKKFIDDNKNNKEFWQEIKDRSPYEGHDVVQEFLDYMKGGGNVVT
jgi:hypothetical protein